MICARQLCSAMFVSVGIYAQSVSGLVTSEDGPLPGATVQVKGTTIGVSTDFDGNFTIEAGTDDVLIVSFVGFATQNISVAGQDQLDVLLMADNELDESELKAMAISLSKLDIKEEEIQEIVKCSKDVVYFCEKYIKIVSIDEGEKSITLEINLISNWKDPRIAISNETAK